MPYPKGISYGHASDIGHWLAMTRRRTEMEYHWCVRSFLPSMKQLSAMKRFRMKFDPSDQMKRSPRMPFGTSFASANFMLHSKTSPTPGWTSLRRHAALCPLNPHTKTAHPLRGALPLFLSKYTAYRLPNWNYYSRARYSDTGTSRYARGCRGRPGGMSCPHSP